MIRQDELNYIPIDKSWAIRCLVLDIINGFKDRASQLVHDIYAPADVRFAAQACLDWDTQSTICVGESGTLLRFLKFLCWKYGYQKKFTTLDTLNRRVVCDDPAIVHSDFDALMKLDGGTSQWASAAALCGEGVWTDMFSKPYKYQLTLNAIRHYDSMRDADKPWEHIKDVTILLQATAFKGAMEGIRNPFIPMHAEDYCFARAFGYLTKDDVPYIRQKWPQLANHESNRFEEMEEAIVKLREQGLIESRDHRVVQALVMLAVSTNKHYECTYQEVVGKSWPRFWEFIAQYDKNVTIEKQPVPSPV